MRYHKKEEDQTLGSAIKTMLSQYKLEDKLKATKAEQLWVDLMGKGVNNYTEKIMVERQVMYVYLTVAELRSELNYGKSKIIKMINEALKEEYIKDIKFC